MFWRYEEKRCQSCWIPKTRFSLFNAWHDRLFAFHFPEASAQIFISLLGDHHRFRIKYSFTTYANFCVQLFLLWINIAFAGQKRSADSLKRSYDNLTNEKKRTLSSAVQNAADAVGIDVNVLSPYVEKAIEIATPIIETLIG